MTLDGRAAEDLAALRRGDEQAFRDLVDGHQSALLRLAMLHVPSRAVAEEVVQETWLGVLVGLDRYEGRASLRTWIAAILVNIARRRAGLEARSVPFSSLPPPQDTDLAGEEPAVDPARFLPDGPYAGHWASFPDDWSHIPERVLASNETREVVRAAIAGLRPSYRTVVTLRDLEGWTPNEVADLLGISDANQRVLLHRARSKVRQALEDFFEQQRN